MTTIDHGLSDEDFWVDDPARDAAVDDRLYEAGLRGALVGAPSRVPLDGRDSLPIMVARVASYQEAAAVPFDDLAVVTAYDVDTSELRAGLLVRRPDGYRKPPPQRIDDDLGEGDVTRIYHGELREQLAIPWRPAKLLLSVVVRDWMSNRALVQLGPSDQSYRDPEVERFLDQEAGRSVETEPWPPAGEPLPSYRRGAQSPEVPEGAGIVLGGTRLVVGDQGAELVLRGSFRLPVARREIVPPPAPDEPTAGRELRPTALLAISLLVVGSDDPIPTVFRLRVPSWGEVTAAGDLVTGHFALDLLDLPGMPRDGQTYFVYAFAGETIAGPVPMALVDPSQLPPAHLG